MLQVNAPSLRRPANDLRKVIHGRRARGAALWGQHARGIRLIGAQIGKLLLVVFVHYELRCESVDGDSYAAICRILKIFLVEQLRFDESMVLLYGLVQAPLARLQGGTALHLIER